jgi:hypothetical protein
MRQSIPVKRKKRGRPATGVDPLVGVRMPPKVREAVEAWAKRQDDEPTLSEAIRQLLVRALAAESVPAKPRRKPPL